MSPIPLIFLKIHPLQNPTPLNGFWCLSRTLSLSSIKISACNCQKIRKSLTARALRAIIKSRNPHIIFLSETKCVGLFFSRSFDSTKTRIWRLWISVGQYGGLVLLWKKNWMLECPNLTLDLYHLELKIMIPIGCGGPFLCIGWNSISIYPRGGLNRIYKFF